MGTVSRSGGERTTGVDQITEVTIPAADAGEYPFHCQMQMYRGTLIVG
ncbi:cupredoxin domain-containing protein [Microbulbifer sp. ALW1]